MPEQATPDDIELARKALLEITTADTIGEPAGFIDEGDGVISVYFDADMLGYPGWRWTASIAHIDGLAPSVLETELMPGDDALLSPDWVPWVDRLADYRSAQEVEGAGDDDLDAVIPVDEVDDDDESDDEESDDDESDDDADDDESDDDESDDDDDDDDEDDDDDDDDEDDDDDDGRGAVLHAGDLDGVDIDTLDDDDEDDDAGDDDDDDDDDEEGYEDDDAGDEDDDIDGDDADESAALYVGVDESDQPESDADGAGDEPPQVPAVDEDAEKD